MKTNLPLITRVVQQLGPKLVFAMVLFIAMALIAVFFLGRHASDTELQAEPLVAGGIRSELNTLRDALKVAQSDLEMQRTLHEVDRRALELVRSEMAVEKERMADLEEGLRFYRSMVVSDDGTTGGLSISKPELVAGGSPGRFAYRIFVQQKEREYEMTKGSLSVAVFGTSGKEEVSYPLAELSEQFGTGAEALHFRYFQAIEGELALPDGFEPRGMILEAHTTSPRETEVREQFPWDLQERFINVGK